MHIKHIADHALIGGMAKLKLDDTKPGRLNCQLKRLERVVNKGLLKQIEIDDGDIALITTAIEKLMVDTGWKRKIPHTLTLTQFCKALIAQSDQAFSDNIQGTLR